MQFKQIISWAFLKWRSVVVTKMAEFRFSISKFYTKIIFFLSFLIKVLYLAKMGHLKNPFLAKICIQTDSIRCLNNEYSFSDILIKVKILWTNYELHTWNLYIFLALDDEFGSTCNNQCLAGVLSGSVFVFILMMLFLIFHKR